MVWSESVAAIVMLSDGTCEEYWNDTGVKTFDGLSVKVGEIRHAANYTVRSMELYLVRTTNYDVKIKFPTYSSACFFLDLREIRSDP